MKNLNQVILTGQIGTTPELLEDKKLVKFSVQEDLSYKDSNGEWVNKKQWHTVIAWNKVPLFKALDLPKWSTVQIIGKLTKASYEKLLSDESGTSKAYTFLTTDIVMEEIYVLSKGNATVENVSQESQEKE